jgi:two-component system, NarL family, uhpT operon response regulator UhpA
VPKRIEGKTMDGIRVAVVDDHRIVAEGMSALLEREGVQVVVTVPSWAELIEHPAMPVDVVVLDLHLGDGILVGTKVRILGTMGIAAVVVSRHADARSIASAMHAGAHAFVAKADDPLELLTAIRAAAEGGTHLADERYDAIQPAADPGLGRQEERALVLYASGRSIREVADEMDTTEETVKSYVKRGRRKFREIGVDIGTRGLLRQHALREGWIAEQQ